MNELKELRLSHGITAAQMVAAIQKIYGGYDKTLHSKCENSQKYGIQLLPPARDAALSLVPGAAEAQKRAKRDRHRFTCRLSCRLDTETWRRLQQQIKRDGYSTMQDFVSTLVQKYLQEREADHGV